MKDKKFINEFEYKVKSTIKQFKLLNKKDKILVACSGGKDSTSILYLLNKLGYNVIALTIDANIWDYSRKNLANIRKYCRQWSIKLIQTSFKKEFGHSLSQMLKILKSKNISFGNCAACGILRRYIINKTARKIKAAKVVTGHNLDDEAQNYLMNLFRTNLSFNARLGPVTGLIKDKKFIPRVKPLYFIEEKEIKKYAELLGLDLVYKRCPLSSEAFRNKVRTLLNDYENKIKNIKKNILGDFIKKQEAYKKKFAEDEKLNYCSECGEPAKEKVCKTCSIIATIIN